jgi:hypothetical protein
MLQTATIRLIFVTYSLSFISIQVKFIGHSFFQCGKLWGLTSALMSGGSAKVDRYAIPLKMSSNTNTAKIETEAGESRNDSEN